MNIVISLIGINNDYRLAHLNEKFTFVHRRIVIKTLNNYRVFVRLKFIFNNIAVTLNFWIHQKYNCIEYSKYYFLYMYVMMVQMDGYCLVQLVCRPFKKNRARLVNSRKKCKRSANAHPAPPKRRSCRDRIHYSSHLCVRVGDTTVEKPRVYYSFNIAETILLLLL